MSPFGFITIFYPMLQALLGSSSTETSAMATKVSVLNVPIMDPEAVSAMQTSFSDPVSNSKTSTFFKIWKSLEKAEGTVTMPNANKMTVFTVSDYGFIKVIPMDVANPFLVSPWLQRLVLMCQLVPGRVDPSDAPTDVKTVSGRTIQLRKTPEGQLTANDIPIKNVYEFENSVIYVLDRLMWIRPEDIELGLNGYQDKNSVQN